MNEMNVSNALIALFDKTVPAKKDLLKAHDLIAGIAGVRLSEHTLKEVMFMLKDRYKAIHRL